MGVNNLHKILKQLKPYSKKDHFDDPEDFMNHLWEHSMLTQMYAEKIADYAKMDRDNKEIAITASMLCGIGEMILLSCNPYLYSKAISRTRKSHEFFPKVEEEIMGIFA